ncbi:MAG: hypothetical protein RLZZ09_1405 [Pseudomonadota bacterium]
MLLNFRSVMRVWLQSLGGMHRSTGYPAMRKCVAGYSENRGNFTNTIYRAGYERRAMLRFFFATLSRASASLNA